MRQLRHLLTCILLWSCASQVQADEFNLPRLGDSTSATISLQEEYRLGRNWSRILRSQAPMLQDPISYQYLEDLVWHLLPQSQVQDRRISVFLLDNPTLNAFAVPGGIIGVHGGLILATETEGELASVLAHELAHLSQRHYAQRLEEERKNRPLMLAGMLAGILVAAADTDGGMAVMSSTMGASMSQQLAFSRRNEQEADRAGMQTLAAAGFDPEAMPNMFGRLQRNYRFFGQKPPEFLLTHPVTESRIADSLNRAQQLPKPRNRRSALEFELIKSRLQVHFSETSQAAVERFEAAHKQAATAANTYGLLLAYVANGQHAQAETVWQALPSSLTSQPIVQMTRIEQLIEARKPEAATQQACELLALYPGSRPLKALQAHAAQAAGHYQEAKRIYEELARDYPSDAQYWFQLAEVRGLLQDRIGVHEARIEYFLLTAQFDLALRQVEFAYREKGLTDAEKARLAQQEREAKAIRQEMKEQF
ncbi:M48 family metallopeptidase [Marinobacterium sp. AK62]|uniref:Putative beta-barrel assembly-enhancing protease n=1 Tax=Marinobacterium alkalitolerans TaxID=1542925 RepID=A0ABS3ZER9_9GAMM|nr:M48 family metalloprotease [Marinobacterium alkalitolerans]MBP0050192.1 M48 family metallopeptidase [Marinobacterium alkalitolerans]